jgi:sterol desaturase/sphingolipid hydroxylase (fatty acid hydroxylase superfamily)
VNDSHLPVIPASRPALRVLFLAAIAAAYALVILLGARIAIQASGGWWIPVALLAGIGAADFVSGLVHWAADTWGRDDLPILGRLLLVPFRVHHVNPGDFLRRGFVDVNGDVAIVAVPVLLALASIRLDTAPAVAAVTFGVVFCAASMLTNQIHQWAHMPRPPRVVRRLQGAGLLLRPHHHAAHHARPYDVRYCITTGWWNGPLERAGFFRRLERLIMAVTRAPARGDDKRYEERYGMTRR